MTPASNFAARPPVCVVLVETSDPGNIGGAARAMKTMGVTDLRLVAPRHYPHPKAVWRSKAARDVVDSARIYANLPAALADCQLAVGLSARTRSLPWPVVAPRQLADKVGQLAPQGGPVGVVFGREKTGLSNAELQLCQWHCVIPASPDYAVLNLSHAVQVVCYELYSQANPALQQLEYASDQPLASQQVVEYMFVALCSLLDQSGFTSKDDVRKLIPRLRRFFARAQLDTMEANIWHGIAAHLLKELARQDNPGEQL